jgi:hypothetical protein
VRSLGRTPLPNDQKAINLPKGLSDSQIAKVNRTLQGFDVRYSIHNVASLNACLIYFPVPLWALVRSKLDDLLTSINIIVINMFMNKFHVSDVDVKLLQIFQAVFEEGSVTAASERLDLGQSLVSHALDRLRSAFHDPLFVRSGRSIAPTDRAQELAPDISRIIEQLHELAEPSLLNKKLLSTIFTLSANDFERRLIGSNLLADMLEEAPNASLRLINTEAPVIETLRSRQCDVVVAPSTLPDLHDFYSEPQCHFLHAPLLDSPSESASD